MSIKINFIIYLPLVPLAYLLRVRSGIKEWLTDILVAMGSGVILVIFTVAPLFLIDMVLLFKQQSPVALMFLIRRFQNIEAQANYSDPNLGDLVVALLRNHLFTAYSVYGFLLLGGMRYLGKAAHRFQVFMVALLLVSLVYFVKTLPHNTVHDYHAYYFLLPALMLLPLLLWRKSWWQIAIIVFFCLGVNVFVTENFYHLFSRTYTDPNGNLVSLHAGKILQQNYDQFAPAGSYILNTSPVVTFYTQRPSINYNGLFVYDAQLQKYSGYTYQENCQRFWEVSDAVRPIAIVFGDPNISASYFDAKGERGAIIAKCRDYLNQNFTLTEMIDGITPMFVRKSYIRK